MERMPDEISKEEVVAVYPQVATAIADALACDIEQVRLDTPLMEGLHAESIDLLDIVFRLERVFKVKISRGAILESARGDLSEAEFERKGYLTDAGLQRLRAYLSEVPSERFRAPMRVADVPFLFTVETFCRVVVRARHTQGR